MDTLFALVVRIVFLLDPKSSKTGEVYESKDGSKLVARCAVEILGGIILAGFSIWANKGQITVSGPTDGFRLPIITAGKIARTYDEDGNALSLKVKTDDSSREAFNTWADVIHVAYGEVRDNPDLRGVWTK